MLYLTEIQAIGICRGRPLIDVSVSNSVISGKPLRCFLEGISEQTTLKRFELSNVVLDNGTLDELLEILSKQTNLNYLRLNQVGIASRHATLLATICSGARELEDFDLSGNDLGDVSMKTIAVAIRRSTSLSRMNMAGVGLSPPGIAELLTAGNASKSLRSLDVSDNGGTDQSTPLLRKAFQLRRKNLDIYGLSLGITLGRL